MATRSTSPSRRRIRGRRPRASRSPRPRSRAPRRSRGRRPPSGSSPGSTLPPGNSQSPASCRRAGPAGGEHPAVLDDRDTHHLTHAAQSRVQRVYVGPVSRDRLSSIHLRRTDENTADIDGGREAPRPAGRASPACSTTSTGRPCGPACPGRAVEWGFRWNDRRRDDRALVAPGHHHLRGRERHRGHRRPAAAGDELVLQGRRRRNLGSRITVVDIDTLRVPPRAAGGTRSGPPTGRSSCAPLLVHAGGLVWCGPYLHVAGTRRGLFSCLVDDIIRVRVHRRRLRLPLRAAGAVRLRRRGERGRGADALLVPLPGPRHGPAAAGGRRVRPSAR